MKILAVIPARGGSKGIPNKNLAKVNNYSLVAIAVKNALDSDCFSKVHVSTDSSLIKDEALKYKADCSYLRPDYLSKSDSKTNAALEFCLLKEKELGNEYDAICELQPTYLFRGVSIIRESISTFIKIQDRFNSLLTLTQIKSTAHPDYACRLEETGEVIFGEVDPDSFNRHEISDYFSFHGMVFVSKVDQFLKNKSLFNSPTYGLAVKNIKKQWDINEPFDLEVAKIIAKNDPQILFS